LNWAALRRPEAAENHPTPAKIRGGRIARKRTFLLNPSRPFLTGANRAKGATMQLDIDIEDWPVGNWDALAERAAQAAGEGEPLLANPRLLASLLFTSDAEVHTLNREWRERDKPTNVLSFPMLEREELEALALGGPPEMLGDIALAYETCAREAAEKGVTLEAHATHLIVHGLLHLAGHDHVESDDQAEAMEALETAILAKLGIADPYGD
jgi:probable rRNA maturation factor